MVLNGGCDPTFAEASDRSLLVSFGDVVGLRRALRVWTQVDGSWRGPAFVRAFNAAVGAGVPLEQAVTAARKASAATVFSTRVPGGPFPSGAVALLDGKPLPPWMAFDATTGTLRIADPPASALPARASVQGGATQASVEVK